MSTVSPMPASKPENGLTTLTPQTMDEALRFAEILAGSSIVPKDYQGSPGNILVAVQLGAEIGLPPLQAIQNIAVINGIPSIWGDAMIALVRGSGLLESIEETISDDGQEATCTVQRRGEEPVTRTFSMEDAKLAGLSSKPGPWKEYPKRMLQMRARSWALRDVFPDVLRGVYMAEEAQDMPRDMGDVEVVAEPAEKPKSRKSRVKAALADKRKSEPDIQPVGLQQVLDAIASADSDESLKASAELAAQLSSDADKKKAREAYKARQEVINTPEPVYAVVMDAIMSASSEDELDAVSEQVALVRNENQRAELMEAMEMRKTEIAQG